MNRILAAIVEGDRATVTALLKADSSLATRQISAPRLYRSKIFHWLYKGDTALHLAAAGYRVEIVRLLLGAGADPNAAGNHRRSGPFPYAAGGYIVRAVRTRCAAAVQCLLKAGADPMLKNKPGSTPFHLAVQNTGRGGSGADVAIAAQKQIIEEFLSAGVSAGLKSSSGKSVRDWARNEKIRDWLEQ